MNMNTNESSKTKMKKKGAASGFRRGFLLGPSLEGTGKTTIDIRPQKKKVVVASNALLELEESESRPKADSTFLIVENEASATSKVNATATRSTRGDALRTRTSSFQLLDPKNEIAEDNAGLLEVSTTQRRPLILEVSVSEPNTVRPCAISEHDPPRDSQSPQSLVKGSRSMPKARPLVEEIDTLHTSPLMVEVLTRDEESPEDAEATALPEHTNNNSATDFDTFNKELSRVLWRLRKIKGSKEVRWRAVAESFANGNHLSTERHWAMVWESLLDSISQSPQALTVELRLGVALAEHRLESLVPFLRPWDNKESRMRAMGAFMVIEHGLQLNCSMDDEKYLSSLLDTVPVMADIGLGAPRKRTVLAQKSIETVLEIVACACDTVCRGPPEQTESLARSVWAHAPIVNQIWTLQQTWIRGSPTLLDQPDSPLVLPNRSLDARHECKLAVLTDWNRVFVQCQELYDQLNSDNAVKETLDARLGRVWSGQLSGPSSDGGLHNSPIGSLRQTLCGSARPRLTPDEIVAHLEGGLVQRHGNESHAEDTQAEWGGLRRSILRGTVAWLGEKKENYRGISQCLISETKLSMESFHSETREIYCLVSVIL
jgi:hypothetical protein